MLTIPKTLFDKMIRHLEAGYPEEACGILIGELDDPGHPNARRVHDVILVANAWDEVNPREGRHNRYLISPDEYIRADHEANRRGLEVVGVFHSHPDHPSQPSETDRQQAWPGLSYVIVSVREGKATTVQSWLLRGERDGFDEEALIVGN
ncbi:MAG: M67 family metallopeptidase [Thermoflexales bacterium]|nr:M67 family metallopeptidase [Thermoflexales bacterium]MDW8351446.1 M67 family metallopeptidase [Anaerolineae bacterium]